MQHLGSNIARIRGLRRLTQKEVADKLKITQPEYSRLENKEKIDDDPLEKIAQALEVPIEVIKNFKEDAVFTNNIYDQNNSINQVYFQFNPIEKIVELYEQVLKEKNEVIKSKDEVIEMFKKQQKTS